MPNFLYIRYRMDDKFIGRKFIDIYEYSSEIFNYYRSNPYQKTKEGLKHAIFDWMDGEYYTTKRDTIEPFLDKYINSI